MEKECVNIKYVWRIVNNVVEVKFVNIIEKDLVAKNVVGSL